MDPSGKIFIAGREYSLVYARNTYSTVDPNVPGTKNILIIADILDQQVLTSPLKSTIASKTACVFVPHVFGIFALAELVELLPGIGLEVVEIFFSVAISIVPTELQVVFEILQGLNSTGVDAVCELAHIFPFRLPLIGLGG
jgi:hypothetical protein